MGFLLARGSVFLNGGFQTADVAVENGRIVSISPSLPRENRSVIEIQDLLIVPGFVDVHVHLREPGFSYKETFASGTAAAAAGGYTAVCPMPNLKPVPDSCETLKPELDAIARDAKIHVYPYGAITAGEQGQFLSDMAEMAPHVAGFSDDGRGVQSDEMMRAAMKAAKALDKPIVAHCEVNALLKPGGCIHDGTWAKAHGFPGISSESEWRQVERDIGLVRETGCPYHVCHISAKESVALIRRAKAEGLPVTCETGPHYLVLCDEDLQDEGRFKMNPPLRSAADRDALLEGLLDGTIDCIATDHAPHSAEEKSKGLQGSAFGIVGLETAFSILYTQLVQTGIVPLELLLDRLCVRPRKIFGLPGGKIAEGAPADLTVLDLNRPHTINSRNFNSMGRATPFDGWMVSAAVAATICNGKLVYTDFQREDT
ncbi:dihydroorotase [Oscillibacter ruminantium]|jgi:dihydroorotase|uniref:dihydroorotase n=1 Tax=Oscillibacter ruminantium TaxID=1263547 RepID=UPI00030DFDF6|nr:dihydroorotase [Oscillibacter ruminantium]MDN0033129.1 dihydroorotase [Oscillibacter valericigenes]